MVTDFEPSTANAVAKAGAAQPHVRKGLASILTHVSLAHQFYTTP